jgi:hypothetical protein
MSLKIGGSRTNSSSSSNTTASSTANSTASSTTTPNVPDWASSLTQNVAGRVGGLLDNNPQSLVAPANYLQNLAGANATNLSGTPWDYDAAADLTGAVANSDTPSIAGNIGQFMNPYLKGVVGATSADFDANAGKVRAQQALDLAGSGAFGGSGAALTQSATEGELARARATSIGNLLSQGYGQALGGATAQAQLQQQQQAQRLAAAGQLAGIAGQYGANQRANIAAQTATGDDLRNIMQQQDQAPVSSTAQIVAMLNGLPINLFTGQTTDGTSNTQTNAQTTGQTKGQSTNIYAGASFGDDEGKAISKLLGL